MNENALPSLDSLSSALQWFHQGGWIMYPLLVCSLLTWWVTVQKLQMIRTWRRELKIFQLQAVQLLLSGDLAPLRNECARNQKLPTAYLLTVALDRIESQERKVRLYWAESVQRAQTQVQQDLRAKLWILATIGSASPFMGLFGTVLGILKSFQEMAKSGVGGFAVVAAGISEALIATAAGIIVAVIAVFLFNLLQVQIQGLWTELRMNIDELMELASEFAQEGSDSAPEKSREE